MRRSQEVDGAAGEVLLREPGGVEGDSHCGDEIEDQTLTDLCLVMTSTHSLILLRSQLMDF